MAAIDKFHLMQLMNEALDEVRRQKQQDVADLKYSRCCVFRRTRPSVPEEAGRQFRSNPTRRSD
ncbi:MAG: transposase [Bacteroidota bacterium]